MKNIMIMLVFLAASGALKAEKSYSKSNCPSGLQPCQIDESCCVKSQSDCSNCSQHIMPLTEIKDGVIGSIPSGTLFTCSDGSSPQKFMAFLRQDGTFSEVWACLPVLPAPTAPAKSGELK